MSQSTRAKQLRREAQAAVQAKTNEIREGIVTELLVGLYRAPLLYRLKWALRIARGESRDRLYVCMFKLVWTADWLLERFARWAGDLLWPAKTCGTCSLGFEGICCDCAGDNYGHTTEISSKSPACANWKKASRKRTSSYPDFM